MKLTDEEKKEIVSNIREAKDKRKQVQIEADLHCVSKRDVKDIMKEYGISLRILNGENFCKSEKQEEQAVEHDWEDMAIPPLAERRRGLVAEVELIDIRLRKYSYFCQDLAEVIESEGVEV